MAVHLDVTEMANSLNFNLYLQLKESNKNNINQEKRFICPVCQSGQRSKGHLLSHVASIHCREDIYAHYDKTQRQCRICRWQSKTYNHLVNIIGLISGIHLLNKDTSGFSYNTLMIPKQ